MIQPGNSTNSAANNARSRGVRQINAAPIGGHLQQRPAVRAAEAVAVAERQRQMTTSEQATSTAISAGKPQRSTTGPPISGPTKAPTGAGRVHDGKGHAHAAASGACSDSVVIIRPLLPSESVITARASRNTHTLPAMHGQQAGDDVRHKRAHDKRLAGVAVGQRAPEAAGRGCRPRRPRRVMMPVQAATWPGGHAQVRQIERREGRHLAPEHRSR